MVNGNADTTTSNAVPGLFYRFRKLRLKANF